ncbi:hypothetical protein BC937DRAFT_90780 [Endogone sp. FLAS-F59071]|nr:hypothetical protein BC937DRAFT_90780 [Endogone sp. FLAS-F59071]|eukprot:RUS23196.1 hypothetical protein BC937DRAFT_90780 [Endogone sp. FLAS-F59071]
MSQEHSGISSRSKKPKNHCGPQGSATGRPSQKHMHARNDSQSREVSPSTAFKSEPKADKKMDVDRGVNDAPSPTTSEQASASERPFVTDSEIQTVEFSVAMFEKLHMGYAITSKGEPAPNQAFKIDPTNSPTFSGVLHKKSSDEMVFQTNWTKAFVDNHMNQGAAEACFHQVTLEVQDNTGKVELRDSHRFVKYRYHISQKVKATIMLKKTNLTAAQEFTQAIRQALSMQNDIEKGSELRKVFQEYGYFWPISVSIGGKVIWSAEYTESANSASRKFSDEVKASLLAKMATFEGSQVGVGGSVGWATEREVSNSAESSKLTINEKIKGGNASSNSLATWENSVDTDASTWDIVSRANVKPIWQMLEDDLRDEVQAIVEMSFKQERLSINKAYNLRNDLTKNYLSWRDVYYDQQDQKNPGKIIITAPTMSNEYNDKMKWKFVRVETAKSSDEPEREYLRYGDVVYIKPSTSDTEYLHLSMSYNSPVTNHEGRLTLRKIEDPKLIQLTDKWHIERSHDMGQGASDTVNNIDVIMRMNSYVYTSDAFRLSNHSLVVGKANAKDGYLASHEKTMEKVRVRQIASSSLRKARNLQDVKNIGVAVKFREVFILMKEDLAKDPLDKEDKRADWIAVVE